MGRARGVGALGGVDTAAHWLARAASVDEAKEEALDAAETMFAEALDGLERRRLAAGRRVMTREELIACGQPIVHRIAFGTVPRLPYWIDARDIIAAGQEGLLRAASSYDPALGAFEAYAGTRIRSAILDALRAEDWLTRYGRTWVSRRDHVVHRLSVELERAPEDDEVAARLAVSLDDYQRMSACVAYRYEAEADVCLAEQSAPVDEQLVRLQEVEQLRAAVGRLSGRKQQVLTMYYRDECTQREIGERLGVTESRVCQILTECEAALRAMLAPENEARRGHRGYYHARATGEAAE